MPEVSADRVRRRLTLPPFFIPFWVLTRSSKTFALFSPSLTNFFLSCQSAFLVSPASDLNWRSVTRMLFSSVSKSLNKTRRMIAWEHRLLPG